MFHPRRPFSRFSHSCYGCDMEPLTKEEFDWLFRVLWKDNAGTCKTCGADEGECLNATCIRTRITNKIWAQRRVTA